MLQGRKLLLADDSLTIQKVVSLTFTDEGMQVTTVSNGAHAIEKLEEIRPDIVLADAFMPALNGYEVCERIKRDERFRQIPVLLLVGSFEPFNEAEARRVGADGVLTKPFQSIRELVSKVGGLLGGHSDGEESARDSLSIRPRDDRPAKSSPPASAQAAPDTPPPARQSSMPAQNQGQSETSGARNSPSHAEAASALNDFAMDDQLIQVSTPAVNSGGTGRPQSPPTVAAGAAEESSAAPESDDKTFEPHGGHDDTDVMVQSYTQSESAPPEEEPELPVTVIDQEEEAAPAIQTQTAFATHMHNAATADDALLDLGDIEPPAPAPAGADDFILDFQYEPIPQPGLLAPSPAPETAIAEGPSPQQEAAQDFGVEVLPPDESQVEEFSATAGEASPAPTSQIVPHVTEELAAPRAENPEAGIGIDSERHQGTAPQSSTPAGGPQIGPEQLSPEAIELIARRAVEHLSERVVQEIAWEVVPQLAEHLIKRRLDEEKKQRPQ